MRKLPPEGEPFEMESIPGQLNFSSLDVERKLKEFPSGSSGGPSGWRGSHLKEMLKAHCKQSFLSALAIFCTRIANGFFSDDSGAWFRLETFLVAFDQKLWVMFSGALLVNC